VAARAPARSLALRPTVRYATGFAPTTKPAPSPPMPFLHHMHAFISHYGYFAVFFPCRAGERGRADAGRDGAGQRRRVRRHRALNMFLSFCARQRRRSRRQRRLLIGREFGFRLSIAMAATSASTRAAEGGAISIPAARRPRSSSSAVSSPCCAPFAAFLAGVNHLAWPRFLFFQRARRLRLGDNLRRGRLRFGARIETYARPVGSPRSSPPVIGAVAGSRFIAQP